jgi:hypothetical protein
MPIVDYPYSFLQGLSDFWQRFFADADQLDAMYRGTAIQIGQAYLDLMSAVLGVALKDAVVFDREYYQLIAMREDEIALSEGATVGANRWVFALPDPVVDFAMLDNRVFEPTASLEPNLDFEVADRTVQFHVDPTDVLGDGVPLAGFARRALDVEVGGTFQDMAVTDWTVSSVEKGDTLRVLDIGTGGIQRKRADYDIVLVRPTSLYVSNDTPFPSTTVVPLSVNYVILRVPANADVTAANFTLASNQATFAHTRLDAGSVRIFAKAPGGNDVVEGVDYIVNYEHGTVLAVTAWIGISGGAGTFAVSYTWREEIHPSVGTTPRHSATGLIATLATTARVLQVSMWAPDTLVDRRTLANNFGSFIGRMENSSEAYRAFLAGVFQLYILGPVLERIESALNVVLNFPVVRDDGELYQSTDTTDAQVDWIFTTRPTTRQTAVYEFPKGTPLRTDLVVGQSLLSFEPLTTAVSVTDYIQDPQWWYGEVIPQALFSPVNGVIPPVFRRTASQVFVEHVFNPSDGAEFGDPGLFVGASDDGDPTIFAGGHTVFRHRVAFVLMDQYLKRHTFSVKFDAAALSATTGTAFAQSLVDLNELVLSAKPSHVFPFTTPATLFEDEIQITEVDISFNRKLGSRVFGPDKVLFADTDLAFGGGVWSFGDYFKYELFTSSTVFTPLGTPITLANAPSAPRHGRLVLVYVAGDVGGRRLIENIDYSVDYANRTVTRLTTWTTSTVNVTYRQLNIGNTANAAPGVGDMLLTASGIDPAIITGAFSSTAAGWDGVVDPPTAARDMGMVERALIVSPH